MSPNDHKQDTGELLLVPTRVNERGSQPDNFDGVMLKTGFGFTVNIKFVCAFGVPQLSLTITV